MRQELSFIKKLGIYSQFIVTLSSLSLLSLIFLYTAVIVDVSPGGYRYSTGENPLILLRFWRLFLEVFPSKLQPRKSCPVISSARMLINGLLFAETVIAFLFVSIESVMAFIDARSSEADFS